MKLIVGLGNPGKSYEKTRHNVGFMVADRLLQANRLRWKSTARFSYATFEVDGKPVSMVKPHSFMNQSGGVLKACFEYFRDVSLSDLLVVADDVNLPLGKVRLKTKGSAGGHHGLESIIQELGSQQFSRLRVGVGQEGLSGRDLTDFVLGVFEKSEELLLEKVLGRAEHACMDWISKGPVFAMNRYNQEEGGLGDLTQGGAS